MCTVSMAGDYFREQFPKKYPSIDDYIRHPYTVTSGPIDMVARAENEKLRKELDELKKEMSEFKKLLIAAKIYDDATDQHECEMAEKVELLKKIADLVGVDLKEVFG